MRLILMVMLLAGFVAVLPAAPASAADAVVNAPCTEAELDVALATVESTGGGMITFSCGGATTITFSDEKTITTDVHFDGADLITLSGGDVTRHFYVMAGGHLTVERLILEDGYEDSLTDFDGGSIWVTDGGSLDVLDSTLRTNRAEFGGALYLNGGSLGIEVTIEGSSLVENEATNGSGGAIYSSGGSRNDDPGATVTIIDSLIADNAATDSAGAIFNDGGAFDNSSGSTLTINGSSLLRNVADSGSGGAVFNSGGAFGDATGGSVEIVDSTLADNAAGSSGGAIVNDGGAFDNSAGGSVIVRRSTLAGNQSGGSGGAIYNGGGSRDYATGGDFRVKNSTLSGNIADRKGGAIFNGDGYDPDAAGGTISIRAATITLNDSLEDDGDGIFSEVGFGSTRLRLSIVADNDTAAGGVDCEGPVFSDGRNLDSDDTCQLIRAHDVPAGAADLAPLADNGGPTLTHRPGAASDALDAGPASCVNQDQRQQPRPSGANCDIGAVEVHPSPPVTVCVSTFTGQVVSATAGTCNPAAYYEVVLPSLTPQTFCYEPVAGALSHSLSGVCAGARLPHILPDDGDLLVCVDIFTGFNRRVADHSDCLANEQPGVLPAI